MSRPIKQPARRPQVSFLIVNWNGRQVLAECLKAISETCQNIPYETILVDNGSNDGSVSMVRERFSSVKLICLDANHFFAYPSNLAARAAVGENLLLLNNDIILHQNCVSRLLSTLRAHDDIGAVAPQLRYPDGRIQATCRRLPTFLNLVFTGLRLDSIVPHLSWKMRDYNHCTSKDVQQPMMSALLIRRQCWEDVGELDERFPLYFNDVDWCHRALRQGWRIRFEPSAQAIHYEAWTGKKLGFRQASLSARGLYRYFRKHHVISIYSWRWPLLLVLVGGLITLLSIRNLALGSHESVQSHTQ